MPLAERIRRYASIGRAIDIAEPGSLKKQAELSLLEK